MRDDAPIFLGTGYPVLQNRVYATREAAVACPIGDIRLDQDAATGLVRNTAFDPGLVVYDGEYDNEQGHSRAFRDHLRDVLALLMPHFGGKSVLEIGCGKGLFLEMLRAGGFDASGVDPSYVGPDESVVRALYSPELGLRAEAIVVRHVLEHIPDPFSFLEMVGRANGGGSIYIEVPSLDWIAHNRTWFDVFYEHVNYFRMQDIVQMFGRVSLAEPLFGGQYLGVVADLGTLRRPSIAATGPFQLESGFTADLDRLALALRGTDYAIWGGASKGVIFSLLMQQRGAGPSVAIDINPAKQNRFMGVSAVPIVSPETAADRLPVGATVIVMNENYLDEIRAVTEGRFDLRAVNR